MMTDRDVLLDINDTRMSMLLQKDKDYIPASIDGSDVPL